MKLYTPEEARALAQTVEAQGAEIARLRALLERVSEALSAPETGSHDIAEEHAAAQAAITAELAKESP